MYAIFLKVTRFTEATLYDKMEWGGLTRTELLVGDEIIAELEPTQLAKTHFFSNLLCFGGRIVRIQILRNGRKLVFCFRTGEREKPLQYSDVVYDTTFENDLWGATYIDTIAVALCPAVVVSLAWPAKRPVRREINIESVRVKVQSIAPRVAAA